MNDDARTAFDHGRQEASVQPDGGKQILVDGLLPEFIGNRNKAAAWRGRSTDVMDEDVHTLEAAQNLTDHLRRALRSRDIRLNEMTACFPHRGESNRHDDCCAPFEKAIGYGFAGAFCAAGYQDVPAAEFIR